MARKIHKVTVRGEEYFIYSDTKQGAVRDVLAHLNEEVACDVATGQELFYLGVLGGNIIGMDAFHKEVSPQTVMALEGGAP